MLRGRGGGLLSLIYVVLGLVIANSHHYLTNLRTVQTVVSAILAVVLWPLLLLGINLHVHL